MIKNTYSYTQHGRLPQQWQRYEEEPHFSFQYGTSLQSSWYRQEISCTGLQQYRTTQSRSVHKYYQYQECKARLQRWNQFKTMIVVWNNAIDIQYHFWTDAWFQSDNPCIIPMIYICKSQKKKKNNRMMIFKRNFYYWKRRY